MSTCNTTMEYAHLSWINMNKIFEDLSSKYLLSVPLADQYSRLAAFPQCMQVLQHLNSDQRRLDHSLKLLITKTEVMSVVRCT